MLAKLLRPGAFMLALVCFILPFLKISCNNQPLIEVKGYDMAFGHAKEKKDTANAADKVKPVDILTKTTEVSREIKIQPIMLIAFISLALGLVLSLLGFKGSRIIQVVLAFAAVGLLIYYRLDYKNQLKIDNSDSGNLLGKQSMKIDVDFLYGFWMALGFSALALISSIVPMGKKEAGDEEDSPGFMESGYVPYQEPDTTPAEDADIPEEGHETNIFQENTSLPNDETINPEPGPVTDPERQEPPV